MALLHPLRRRLYQRCLGRGRDRGSGRMTKQEGSEDGLTPMLARCNQCKEGKQRNESRMTKRMDIRKRINKNEEEALSQRKQHRGAVNSPLRPRLVWRYCFRLLTRCEARGTYTSKLELDTSSSRRSTGGASPSRVHSSAMSGLPLTARAVTGLSFIPRCVHAVL